MGSGAYFWRFERHTGPKAWSVDLASVSRTLLDVQRSSLFRLDRP